MKNHHCGRLISENGSYTLDDEAHCSDVMQALNRQRRSMDKRLCDITLAVSGAEVVAHKSVLAACSEYFRWYLAEVQQERKSDSGSQRTVVALPGFNLKAFLLVLEYMYTSTLRISRENIYHVLIVSCMLQIQQVTNACLAIFEREKLWQKSSPKIKTGQAIGLNKEILKKHYNRLYFEVETRDSGKKLSKNESAIKTAGITESTTDPTPSENNKQSQSVRRSPNKSALVCKQADPAIDEKAPRPLSRLPLSSPSKDNAHDDGFSSPRFPAAARCSSSDLKRADRTPPPDQIIDLAVRNKHRRSRTVSEGPLPSTSHATFPRCAKEMLKRANAVDHHQLGSADSNRGLKDDATAQNSQKKVRKTSQCAFERRSLSDAEIHRREYVRISELNGEPPSRLPIPRLFKPRLPVNYSNISSESLYLGLAVDALTTFNTLPYPISDPTLVCDPLLRHGLYPWVSMPSYLSPPRSSNVITYDSRLNALHAKHSASFDSPKNIYETCAAQVNHPNESVALCQSQDRPRDLTFVKHSRKRKLSSTLYRDQNEGTKLRRRLDPCVEASKPCTTAVHGRHVSLPGVPIVTSFVQDMSKRARFEGQTVKNSDLKQPGQCVV